MEWGRSRTRSTLTTSRTVGLRQLFWPLAPWSRFRCTGWRNSTILFSVSVTPVLDVATLDSTDGEELSIGLPSPAFGAVLAFFLVRLLNAAMRNGQCISVGTVPPLLIRCARMMRYEQYTRRNRIPKRPSMVSPRKMNGRVKAKSTPSSTRTESSGTSEDAPSSSIEARLVGEKGGIATKAKEYSAVETAGRQVHTAARG